MKMLLYPRNIDPLKIIPKHQNILSIYGAGHANPIYVIGYEQVFQSNIEIIEDEVNL